MEALILAIIIIVLGVLYIISTVVYIYYTYQLMNKLDNRRRSERKVIVTLPEPKLDTIIIRDTIPQYYFIYDYE